MEDLRERQLIKKAIKGHTEAFESLILKYEKKIYNLCLYMLKDSEEAYDAAQEVCLKIWRQLDKFEGNSKFSTWIYRITTNQCLDILRKNKKRSQDISLFQSNEEDDQEWLLEGEKSTTEVSETIEKKELQEILSRAIHELKEEHQVVLILRDLENYSYEEIATILDLSLGTVKSRLSRARGSLKKILEQDKEPYKSFFRQIKS